MKIPSWKAFEYVSVYRILEMKDGCVYKTQFKGYAHKDRVRQPDETYAGISTKLTSQDECDLVPFLE